MEDRSLLYAVLSARWISQASRAFKRKALRNKGDVEIHEDPIVGAVSEHTWR
jgi:hypothetical protein